MIMSTKTFNATAAVLIAAFLGSAFTVNAKPTKTEEAVLFKIHDIVPVKNSEGDVVGCDYSTTFYNRSSAIIRNAILNLSWQDTAISEVIDQEKKEDAARNKRSINRAKSATERTTDTKVESSIEVPELEPAQQALVTSRINTDRCFLLIEDVDFKVRSCNYDTSGGNAGKNRGSSSAGCAELFKFVSPKDAQYYLEFKAISVEEAKSAEQTAFEKKKAEIDELYGKSVETIDAINAVVSEIK